MELVEHWGASPYPFLSYEWSAMHACPDEVPLAVLDDDGEVAVALLWAPEDRAVRNTACWPAVPADFDLDRLHELLRARGVVAGYLRHEREVGETDPWVATLFEGWSRADMAKSWHRDLRRAERECYVVISELVPDRNDPAMARWCEVHAHTMDRRNADWSFRNRPAYFEAVARCTQWRTELVEVFHRETGDHCGSVVMMFTDEVAIYGWGAAWKHKLRWAPVKMALVHWAEQRRWKRLELGGGMASGDSLEWFKVRMGAQLVPRFREHLVLDADGFEEMCALRGVEDRNVWFPPWRWGPIQKMP